MRYFGSGSPGAVEVGGYEGTTPGPTPLSQLVQLRIREL